MSPLGSQLGAELVESPWLLGKWRARGQMSPACATSLISSVACRVLASTTGDNYMGRSLRHTPLASTTVRLFIILTGLRRSPPSEWMAPRCAGIPLARRASPAHEGTPSTKQTPTSRASCHRARKPPEAACWTFACCTRTFVSFSSGVLTGDCTSARVVQIGAAAKSLPVIVEGVSTSVVAVVLRRVYSPDLRVRAPRLRPGGDHAAIPRGFGPPTPGLCARF